MKREVILENRKSITLKVVKDTLIIKAPHHVDQQRVESFILSKNRWIQNQLKFQELITVSLSCPIYIFSIPRQILLKDGKLKFELNSESLLISKPKSLSENTVLKKLELFLNSILLIKINEYIQEFQLIKAFEYQEIKIKKLSVTWGNCNSKKRLTFSSHLIFMDEKFVRAVVAHEISHLFEMNHSKKFYQTLFSFCPSYKQDIKAQYLDIV